MAGDPSSGLVGAPLGSMERMMEEMMALHSQMGEWGTKFKARLRENEHLKRRIAELREQEQKSKALQDEVSRILLR